VKHDETTPKLPASPLLSADPKATLTFSAERDGSLRVTYQRWEDAKVFPPEGGRSGREGGYGAVFRKEPTPAEIANGCSCWHS
jgi:hypothetical protein